MALSGSRHTLGNEFAKRGPQFTATKYRLDTRSSGCNDLCRQQIIQRSTTQSVCALSLNFVRRLATSSDLP